jgi:hypothetical protein
MPICANCKRIAYATSTAAVTASVRQDANCDTCALSTELVEDARSFFRVDEHEQTTNLTAMVDVTGKGRIRVAHEAQAAGKFRKQKADICSVVQETDSILHNSQALLEFLRISCGGYLS